MNMKKIVIPLVIILLFLLIYWTYFRKSELIFSLIETTRGNISQEISETGQVRGSKELNLTFKSAGRIEEIYVEVGEKVKEKDVLAKLENSDLKIQLKEAQANLNLAQAKLNKLLSGASPQEIQVVQTTVNNAEISLKTTQQSLEDVKKTAKENLDQDYEDGQNTLNDAYLKIYNAFYALDPIQRTYFTGNDQEGLNVRENKNTIEREINSIKLYLDTAKASNKNEDIDVALSQMKTVLKSVSDSLKIIREVCEEPSYRNLVSSTDKTTLDNQRSYINNALTNVTNSQQTIALSKITNESNINTAQSKVLTAEGVLKKAQDELSLLLAPPRQEDIDLYGAEVDKAKTKVQLLEKQIEETILRSPIASQITRINKKEGEQVQPALQDVVFSLLGDLPFEIKANIYEEDVVKIEIGNPVDISLVAFPNKIFKGKVIFIDPAEKLVEGVVYYEVTIGFEEMPEKVKPGMTTDLIIKTAVRENVLMIPQDCLQEKDGKTIIEVSKDRTIESREIEVGLRGSNNMVEVISGIGEGEKIILR